MVISVDATALRRQKSASATTIVRQSPMDCALQTRNISDGTVIDSVESGGRFAARANGW